MTDRYRVLVTGSRTWNRARDIWIALDVVARTHSPMTLVHGDCPQGADAIADRWAEVRHIPRERHPAQWNVYGKRAGFFRNQGMVNTIPDLCLAFIREGSSGATHCAMAARRAAIPLLIIPWEDRW